MSFLERATTRVGHADPIGIEGAVISLRGLTLRVADFPAVVGALVRIKKSQAELLGEVVGFDGNNALVMLLGNASGVRVGDRVELLQSSPTIDAGRGLLGRVINALSNPIDSKGAIKGDLEPFVVRPPPMGAMERGRITDRLETGIRALDLFTTLGRGQRMGIFAGPGVGKSTLLAMASRRTEADINVIALIGERGREVREFIEDALGEEGLANSIVVVSTSDESPVMRVRAAFTACAVADYFRDRGNDVLFVLDSITRLAQAQRQIGLAVGEPPATRGYTPSVFSLLPELLERAGAVEATDERAAGSITGLYTVLVEGDDMTEPIADAVRGILDGHLALSRKLAQRAHYPAIDVLDSISRVARQICTDQHNAARNDATRLLAAYRESEELIRIGAYAHGSSPDTDAAIALLPHLDTLLQQGFDEDPNFDQALALLNEIAEQGNAMTAQSRPIPQPSTNR